MCTFEDRTEETTAGMVLAQILLAGRKDTRSGDPVPLQRADNRLAVRTTEGRNIFEKAMDTFA